MPAKEQANTCAAVLHDLKAADTAGSTETVPVVARMKSFPVDEFGKPATIRDDGRVIYDLKLYAVKSPSESKGPWDYYKEVRALPGREAFAPPNPDCPFLPKP